MKIQQSKPGQILNGRKLVSSEHKKGRTWWKHTCEFCGGDELEHEANRIKMRKSWPHECPTQESGESHQEHAPENTNYIKNCQVCNAGLTEVVNEVLEDHPGMTAQKACKQLYEIAIKELSEDDIPNNFTPENLRNRYRYHTGQVQRTNSKEKKSSKDERNIIGELIQKIQNALPKLSKEEKEQFFFKVFQLEKDGESRA